MKIKLFIVTYNNPEDLNLTLKSIFKSIDNTNKHNIEINIINNHSNFNINKDYLGFIKILNNVLRPNFSTGHLSRNWNQALILGFENLISTKSDIVITC